MLRGGDYPRFERLLALTLKYNCGNYESVLLNRDNYETRFKWTEIYFMCVPFHLLLVLETLYICIMDKGYRYSFFIYLNIRLVIF